MPLRFDPAAVDHRCHFLFKFRGCCTQLTRFNLLPPSFSEISTQWFDSSTALHLYNSKPVKDKAKWTRLVHIFVISARIWCLYLRYPSVTFSLRLLLLLGRKTEPGKYPISISGYYKCAAYSQSKRKTSYWVTYTRTYFFPPDRYRSVGQKTSK